jgi:hypothetical protein
MSQAGNHGLRFSVRGLLFMVTFCALAFAALKFANNGWWLAVSTTAMLLLLAMTIVALVDRGPRRAFAIGFLASVVVYGTLLFAAGRAELYTRYTFLRLPTTQQLVWLFTVVEEDTIVRSPNQMAFMSIGHVLWAVVLGFLSGQFARFVYARREEPMHGNERGSG